MDKVNFLVLDSTEDTPFPTAVRNVLVQLADTDQAAQAELEDLFDGMAAISQLYAESEEHLPMNNAGRAVLDCVVVWNRAALRMQLHQLADCERFDIHCN